MITYRGVRVSEREAAILMATEIADRCFVSPRVLSILDPQAEMIRDAIDRVLLWRISHA